MADACNPGTWEAEAARGTEWAPVTNSRGSCRQVCGVLGHGSHSLTLDQVSPLPQWTLLYTMYMCTSDTHTHAQYTTTQCTNTLICLSDVAAAVGDSVFNLIILLWGVSVILILSPLKWTDKSILSVKLHFDNGSETTTSRAPWLHFPCVVLAAAHVDDRQCSDLAPQRSPH